MDIVTVILVLLAVGAVFLLLLLLMPVKVDVFVFGGTDTGFEGTGTVAPFNGALGVGFSHRAARSELELWLFGRKVLSHGADSLVRKASRAGLKKVKKDRKKEDKEEEKPEKKAGTVDRLKHLVQTTREMKSHIRRALLQFGNLVRVRRFHVSLTLGLANPAITGYITGFLFMVNGMLSEKYRIRPGWEFTKRVARGSASVGITVSLLTLWKMVFAFAPVVIRLYRKDEPENSLAA